MAAEAAMESNQAHAEHSGPSYIAVFIYLSVLTGVELLVYAMNFPTDLKIGLLVALALAKAVLVAMYFMHLATEHKGLWVIAATPMVLVAFCYLMLRPDLSKRAWAHIHQSPTAVTEPAAAPPQS
ncbi:MAG TPA: cytochrome C oxidase subunit IV family protein [Candidatus Binataceae bacterium]|nr:cytochrome C oxidase subunit IV family protein [Candidatus Binataceae bacterium]